MPVICPTGQVFFGLAYAARMRATPANGWCRSASSANVEGSRAAPDRRDKKRAARRPAAAAQADLDSAGRHPPRPSAGRAGRQRNLHRRRERVAQPARCCRPPMPVTVGTRSAASDIRDKRRSAKVVPGDSVAPTSAEQEHRPARLLERRHRFRCRKYFDDRKRTAPLAFLRRSRMLAVFRHPARGLPAS
jgi:hypothetical protein